MDRLAAEDLNERIARAWATDLSTGQTQDLATRRGSRCHFFEPFRAGPYKVRLRLDWQDIDYQGNPTLDADFCDPETGRVDVSMKRHTAHHTSAQPDGLRTYLWKFRDAQLALQIGLSWRVTLPPAKVQVTATCTRRVIRANGK